FPAQAFPKGPDNNHQFSRAGVVQQITGMRIAVENGFFSGSQERHSDQSLDQLLSDVVSSGRWQSRGSVRHLDPVLFRKGSDCGSAKKRDHLWHSHTGVIAVKRGGLLQGLLLAAEIDLVLQQAPNFSERVRDQVRRKSVTMMPIAKILRQPL